jgi:hypothetical protein
MDIGSLTLFARVCTLSSLELDQALVAIVEAVDLYQRLASHQPQAFTEKLSVAYRIQAGVLQGLGRRYEDAEWNPHLDSHEGRLQSLWKRFRK